MKCFIHTQKESVASCTKCGKAMCVDCSSFSSHSGICPACRKSDLDKESASLKREIKALEAKQVVRLVFAILLFFLIIPIILYKSFKLNNQKTIAKLEEKIININKSLRFVNEALSRGSKDLGVDNVAAVSSDNDSDDDAWQCSFCRTINKSGRVCKFCARKKS